MTVASGVIPYFYEGTYPFIVPNNNSIGMSGILFEQAMMVQTAEIFRFAGSADSPPTFIKYINKNSPTTEFTPRPDGYNLDGRVDGSPAGAYFIDYITDLRTGMLSTHFFYSFDLAGDFSTWLTDWLLWVGGPSGTQGNFTRGQYSSVGDILSTDFFDLGASGVLSDIDLREVSYQPYSRMARSFTVSYKLATVRISPVFPAFMDTNGMFVLLNSREQSLSFSVGGITRTSADFQTGEMIIDGDMFYSDTDFSLIPGTATRENLEGVITHNAFPITSVPGRIFRGNADNTVDPRGKVTVTPPSLSPGGYGVGAINSLTAHPKLVVPSGTLSFNPSIRYNGGDTGSGFFVFNESFWIQDDDLALPSGLRLLNPFTRQFQWFRIADQTNVFDDNGTSHAWSSLTTHGLMDDGASYIKMATLPAPIDTDTKMGFFLYDQSTLDLSSVARPSQDWTVFGASTSSPLELIDACFDGTFFYALTIGSVGPARNIFIFDTAYLLSDSKSYLAKSINWLQVGIFTGGVFAGTGATMIELIIDFDPGNDTVTDTGITYTVDVTVAAWPGSHTSAVVVLHPPRNIASSAHFTPGTWIIAENTLGVIIMFRGILSGSSIVPQEGFVLPLGNSYGAPGYEFVHGTYTS